ncbi:MAG: hypothetical protein ABIW85_07520 [Variovorax sp.]
MRKQLARRALTLFAALTLAGVLTETLSGCAIPGHLPVGISRAEAVQRLGAPSATYALPGGAVRLQYAAGMQVTNVDVDANNRVISVRDELEESLFARTIQIDQWHEADVLRTYGRPDDISRVASFNGPVWAWRYRGISISTLRYLYIYLDPQGVVRRYNTGDDPHDPLPQI